MDHWPNPVIQMNAQDTDTLKVRAGDLLKIYNDNHSTQMVAYPTGVHGNFVSPGVNEFSSPTTSNLGRDPQDRRRTRGHQ